MKQRFILVSTTSLVVLLLIVLVSCGAPAPTPTPTPSTPSSQSTPAPTPSAPSTSEPSVAPVPSQSRGGANGTLAKIDGNTLTLTTAQGPVTVSVNSNTTIRKTVLGSFSDIQEGAMIFSVGELDAKNNIIATSIRIQSADESSRPPPSTTTPSSTQRQRQGIVGTVTKIERTLLIINTGQGLVTVNITSSTVIQKSVTGVLADLRVGGTMSVMGIRDASGIIAATSIRLQE